MYYHHKNHNILMIIICALRGTTNFTQALNGGHGQTQQTSPLIYLKIQVEALEKRAQRNYSGGCSTPFFLQLQKSIYESYDSDVIGTPGYYKGVNASNVNTKKLAGK